MRFDWTDLELFVHACDAGSLTGAAARGHLTLAAASARMKALEDQAGTALLQRHSRGVRPTPAGEALARHARALLVQRQLLQGELAQHGQGARGRVRLLCNSAAAALHLPPRLGPFLLAHPAIDVQLEESPSHLTVQALRDGQADLGVVSDAVDTAGLRCAALCDDPLALALPRGHALGTQRRVAFAEALAHELVGFGPASALHAHLSLHAARLGRPMRLRASLGHVEAVCALVAQGVGPAVLPLALLERARQATDLHGRLTVRPLADDWARRRLLLCAPAEGPAAAPAQRLFEHLRG